MIGDGGVTPHFIERRKKMAVIGAILGDISGVEAEVFQEGSKGGMRRYERHCFSG